MNEIKRENEFRNWLSTKVNTQAPLSSYPRALKEFIPIKLNELNETKYDNLFKCIDIDYLKILQIRLLKNGDLHQFNIETQSRLPSASIDKYIEFLSNENISIVINSKSINQSLNQILFGPPGTGKTFNTINKALEIIDNDFFQQNKDDRTALKDKFDEYKKAGLIEFVTFHQSYGYEEFVEGIKAIPVGKEGNEDGTEMIYAISDGIFKKLSKKSLEEFLISNTSSNINKKRFILNAKSLNIQAELIQDDENNFRVIKGSKMRKGYATSFEQYNYFKLRKEVEDNAKLKEESEFFIFEEDYGNL